MKTLRIKSNPAVKAKFDNYPTSIREKMQNLRRIIIEAAEEEEGTEELEETLKWGEPSYLTKKGSTIRIDWKENSPDQYAMYFQCTSKLVPTFRTVYSNTFAFEGNRAIVFPLEDKLAEDELKKCIKVGLSYHKVKQELLLGL